MSDLLKETERLNAALDVAERKLQHLELGVAAWVKLPSGPELHFRKGTAGWGLDVLHGADDQFVTWRSTSRKTRTEIGHALSALYAAMIAEVERHTVMAKEAADAAEGWTP